jgi:hypothetical protein
MRLDFDAATHTYRVGRQVLPSVTEVLGPAESFAGVFDRIPPANLEAARDRGTYVHEAMALLVRGDLDWDSVEPQWLARIRQGERFLQESGLTVIASELRVYSASLRVAGTLDLFASWRRRHALLDFKATAAIPVTVGPQTAGYEFLYRDQYGVSKNMRIRRYCVHLRDDSYRVVPLEDSRDESIFMASLSLYHWGSRENAAAVAA